MQDQSLTLNCSTQLLDEREPVAAVVDRRRIHLVRLVAHLRAIHRHVRTTHEADAVAGIRRCGCDADARTDPHADPVEDEGLLQQCRETPSEPRGVHRVTIDEHSTELIATDPDENVGGA